MVKREGPWRGVDDLELATSNWVHRFNDNRPHSSLSYKPPVEFEERRYRQNNPAQQPLPGELGLHRTVDASVNGAVYGSLLPRHPQIPDQVDPAAGQFGLVLAGIGIGPPGRPAHPRLRR